MIVCKYKFDSSIYNNLIPEFNSGYNGYSVNDTTDGNIITRTIECDALPTLMRFGQVWVDGEVQEDYTRCLLEVLDMNTSELTNCRDMFRYCTNLTSINCNWNTSNVTDIYAMFYYCNNLTQLDVSNFNTSKVHNMGYMFHQCYNLTQLDVSNFDTSNVTDMRNMFNSCTNLTSLDVSNFNTSNVTNMNSMFFDCKNLTELDVSNFDTRNVTNMGSMFFNCHNLTSLNVSNFNTSNVAVMSYITYQCRSLKTLSLSSWNFDSVTTAVEMFYDCYRLVTLDAPNMRIPNYGDNFFGASCPVKYIRVNNLDAINTIEPQLKYARTSDNPGYIITNIDKSLIPADTISALASKNWIVVSDSTLTKVTEYVYDSKICRSMIPKFNDEFVKYFIDDVEDENGLVTRIISSMDELPTLMRFGQTWVSKEVQQDYTKCLLEVLDMNTSELTNCNSMFRYCTNLTSINCNWNTSNVADMYAMFNACTKLTQLDVSNFNTSNVTNMRSMFHNCINLTQLDVSNFNTSQVTYMDAMFYSCDKLTSLDVSNFDTSNVANMESMFNNCTNLTQLDLSNFDTSNVTIMEGMFYNCTNLTQLDLSNFDTSKVTTMGYMFDNTSKLVNIGMLYCSPSTINTISSNLSNTLQKNIWIQNVKPSELPSYDYISYKKYKEEKELNLNSPLLEGDKIVKKDGKMYHYHKMGKVVLDGSENWSDRWENHKGISIYSLSELLDNGVASRKYMCDNLQTPFSGKYLNQNSIDNYNQLLCHGQERYSQNIYISLDVNTLDEFKQWLSENPTTVIYELANPYYEEISNDTLYLSIDKLSDYKMVVNNSTIPTKNMVQNRTFSTITLKPNTVYTVKFDRIGTDELTIDLGGTITTCVGNKVEIITSNEITRDDIVFYGDDEISNVMVIESSFDEEAMPDKTFEGVKSSFEDEYIPSEEDNLSIIKTIEEETITAWYKTTAKLCPLNKIKPNTDYTLIYNLEILDTNNTAYTDMDITTGITTALGNSQYFGCKNGINIIKFKYGEKPFNEKHQYLFIRPLRRNTAPVEGEYATYKVPNIYLFEGDWTHLTEEDFNNLGKYKVEYKTINCPIEFGKGGRIK